MGILHNIHIIYCSGAFGKATICCAAKLALAVLLTQQLLGCAGGLGANDPLSNIQGCKVSRELLVSTSARLDCDSVDHLEQLADNADFASLSISPKAEVKNLDVSRFTHLQSITIVNDQLEALTLRRSASFSFVSIKAPNLKSLQLPEKVENLRFLNASSLVDLNGTETKVIELTLIGLLKLDLSPLLANADIRGLAIMGSNIKNVNLSLATHLESVYLQVFEFDPELLSTLPNLRSLSLVEVDLANLDLSDTAITTVSLYDSNIPAVHLPNVNSAGGLFVLSHKAETLTISGGAGFEDIYMNGAGLKLLDISSMRTLNYFSQDDMQIDLAILPNNSSFNKYGGTFCPAGIRSCNVLTL